MNKVFQIKQSVAFCFGEFCHRNSCPGGNNILDVIWCDNALGVACEFYFGGSFVEKINRLVGKKSVANVLLGKFYRRLNRFGRNLYAMERFVFMLDARKHFDSNFYAWFFNKHLLEASFQSGIFFDIAAILVDCRGSDKLNFSSG